MSYNPVIGSSLCLCMMVRNESSVILRALESAKPHIHYWVIVDTGSDDGTYEMIAESLQDIPGELYHRPWVNFGHNRTEVLQLAKGKADYMLIMDADMILNVYAPFHHKLKADAYEIRYEGDLDYSQWMLISGKHDWSYVGVTHEYIQTETFETRDWLPEVSLTHLEDGGNRADKFERDIRLLLEDYQQDPKNSRNLFYLAQSFKDLDQYEEALKWYELRSKLVDTWEEERWYASFQAARMRLLLNQDWSRVRNDLLQVFEKRPWRLEPLFLLIQTLRQRGEVQAAFTYVAFVCQGIPYPVKDTLFIEKTIYRYLLDLEYGICAYATGRISEAIRSFTKLLKTQDIPQTVWEQAVLGLEIANRDLHPVPEIQVEKQLKITVVSAFYNAGEFLENQVKSLLSQQYDNFRILYIDDASTDSCSQYIPESDPRISLIRNISRKGIAYNLHQAITKYCEPDELIVLVDGDDSLKHEHVLQIINHYYQSHNCWVMYSQFEYSDGSRGFCEPFASPKDILIQRAFWRSSHLKTFKAGLFHAIEQIDPSYECLKNQEGEWLESAVDAAIMFPLIEMAGFEKVRYCDQVLYTYNDHNPLSHHHHQMARQSTNFLEVASKRPFPRITSLPTRSIPKLEPELL